MRVFTKLKVWGKAHSLVLTLYEHKQAFPHEEQLGLTAHLLRSAISIPSNFAEGCGRETDRELARFLSIAAGSASETVYQLLLARDLGYLNPKLHRDLDEQVNEIKRMLNAFIQRLAQSHHDQPKA